MKKSTSPTAVPVKATYHHGDLRRGLLDAALALEHREFLLLFDTADKTEGMRAFLDKRKPVFKHR